MGRKRPKGETFESAVRRQFDPVAERLGLVDTPLAEHMIEFGGVNYVRDDLLYDWGHDPRERYLWVTVHLDRDDEHYSISLDALVVDGGFGVAQDLRSGGQTWLAMEQAIASHTEWIERLHPRLIGPAAPAFILSAGGRMRMPDAARYQPGSETGLA